MKSKKLWGFIIAITFIIVISRILGISSWILSGEAMNMLKGLVEEHLILAILIYILVTVISCVFLALPGITFAIAAGVLFGPILGTISCSISATLGAMLAFLAGRYFLKDSIKPSIEKNKYIKKWLFDESGKNEIFILMVTRLIPVFPYNLQNFAYGITDISFAKYSIWSFVFMLPGTAIYTVGFASVNDRKNMWLYLLFAACMATIVIGVSAILKRIYISDDEGKLND
ncbi:TVP38/TMEM64 family protein [Mogibacterium sp.]